ncbi:Uncharacterised protein [Ewingella americana]|uniref:Uncharacterized protein n=1 Tax=Ewingella americana TaxID=41202 RepID=A0A377NAC2_9GAMM|nr:Uncharacterised protein [Ewingella americana]
MTTVPAAVSVVAMPVPMIAMMSAIVTISMTVGRAVPRLIAVPPAAISPAAAVPVVAAMAALAVIAPTVAVPPTAITPVHNHPSSNRDGRDHRY